MTFAVSFPVMAQDEPCLPIELADNQVSLAVSIAGNNYRAMLNTSNIPATMTTALAQELELPIRTNSRRRLVSGFGDNRPYTYVEDIDLEFSDSVIPTEELALIESDETYIGLSLRIFDGNIIQVDFSESKICFFPRDAVNLREVRNAQIDSDPESGNPVVRVSINDGEVDTWLVLAFGYPGSLLLDSSKASLLGLYDEDTISQEVNESLLQVSVNNVSFGPYSLDDVSVEFPKRGVEHDLSTREPVQTGTRISLNKESDGRIGIDFLKRFTLTMDLGQERLHIFQKYDTSFHA